MWISSYGDLNNVELPGISDFLTQDPGTQPGTRVASLASAPPFEPAGVPPCDFSFLPPIVKKSPIIQIALFFGRWHRLILIYLCLIFQFYDG